MTDPSISRLHEVCAMLSTGQKVVSGIDPEVFGAAIGDLIREAIDPLVDRIRDLEARLDRLQVSTTGGGDA
ncbi:hypothetical protein [Methylibium sp. Root1272]|uniref:hypothetical protein n=1 Tax=Methylibium sp. Root1272 TaxID=1736441 RepID=UPI000ADF7D72|nr:hypothetical protein [Methylibium sp. Root1272]